jgi:hypothetical protein
MRYFGATAPRDGINNLDRNSVKNAMATFQIPGMARHFLLSAMARDLSLTGLIVNAAYHSKLRVQVTNF